jgi:Probable molybdopterin binding domain
MPADSSASKEVVTAALLVIGGKILSGRTKDQNISYGIDLKEVRVVGDEETAIVDALNALRHRHTYVFTTGGIGPAHGDVTADCVAKAFGVPIDTDPRALAILHECGAAHPRCTEARACEARGRGHARASAANSACALSRRKQGFESGSANNFNDLAGTKLDDRATSPTFLQWTVLPKIGSRPPCDRRLEEAEEIGAVTAEPASVLTYKDDPRSHRGALRGAN